jgi:hypothetical protein
MIEIDSLNMFENLACVLVCNLEFGIRVLVHTRIGVGFIHRVTDEVKLMNLHRLLGEFACDYASEVWNHLRRLGVYSIHIEVIL